MTDLSAEDRARLRALCDAAADNIRAYEVGWMGGRKPQHDFHAACDHATVRSLLDAAEEREGWRESHARLWAMVEHCEHLMDHYGVPRTSHGILTWWARVHTACMGRPWKTEYPEVSTPGCASPQVEERVYATLAELAALRAAAEQAREALRIWHLCGTLNTMTGKCGGCSASEALAALNTALGEKL